MSFVMSIPSETKTRKQLPRITSNSLMLEPDGRVSSWNTLPLFDGTSLEEEVERGDATERREAESHGQHYAIPIAINQTPQIVFHSLRWLVKRHENLSSLSAVSRYVSRTGVKVLRRIDALRTLEMLWRRAYTEGTEFDQFLFINRSWAGFRELSADATYAKSSHFLWVKAVIEDIAAKTGLPVSTIALGTLVAGLAQSIEWIPEHYVDSFGLKILGFCRYLESRASPPLVTRDILRDSDRV